MSEGGGVHLGEMDIKSGGRGGGSIYLKKEIDSRRGKVPKFERKERDVDNEELK